MHIHSALRHTHTHITHLGSLFQWAVYLKKTVHKFQWTHNIYKLRGEDKYWFLFP